MNGQKKKKRKAARLFSASWENEMQSVYANTVRVSDQGSGFIYDTL